MILKSVPSLLAWEFLRIIKFMAVRLWDMNLPMLLRK